jgi:hypothetical protein
MQTVATSSSRALKFVLMIGMLGFFADFTCEGSRSILGPYLAMFQASGATVAIVTAYGELAGYGLRLVSGREAVDQSAVLFGPLSMAAILAQGGQVPICLCSLAGAADAADGPVRTAGAAVPVFLMVRREYGVVGKVAR